MPRRSKEYMQAQRARFCEAASTCFNRNGVGETSLNDICAETGLTMGALYKHFANKEELLIATLELAAERAQARPEPTTWAEMKAMLTKTIASAERGNPIGFNLRRIWLELIGIAAHDQSTRDVIVRNGGQAVANFERWIERLTAAGEIAPPFDSRKTANLIACIMDGWFLGALAHSPREPGRAEMLAYLDFAVGAIVRDQEGAAPAGARTPAAPPAPIEPGPPCQAAAPDPPGTKSKKRVISRG